MAKSISLHNPWLAVKDGDPRALGLYRRHYSRRVYRDGRRPRLIVGPGEKTVLLLTDGRGLFAWRRFVEIGQAEPQGVNCSVFRNESPEWLSSILILWAEEFAQHRWGAERLYTYVDPAEVESSNPGFCFQVAGWRKCGTTKSGLVVLEKRP